MEYKHHITAVTVLLTAVLFIISFASSGAQSRRGKASFYSKRATGARSASGERIHHDSLTCAHRTYPFGTRLKVTNLRNGKSIIVRVTDRGPHARGRIIDLSYGAARALGMLAQGIAMVEVERVNRLKVPYRDEEETGMPDFEFDFKEMRQNLLNEISTVKIHPKTEKKVEEKKKETEKKTAEKRTAEKKTTEKKVPPVLHVNTN